MNIIYFIILCPFIGFLLLTFFSHKFSKKFLISIGVTSIGISFILTSIIITKNFFDPKIILFNIWNWIIINNVKINISFLLDGLSLIMLLMITGIGFLIHIFSIWYMQKDSGYARFFAYTNLFIGCMILLVLANNFLLMYLGWETVGLCSYLLVNFYYKDSNNGKCAIKAFLITRIGDLFLLLGIFIIFYIFNTLNFIEIENILFNSNFAKNNKNLLEISVLMLLIGSIAKSAQFPLHVWLPNAMVAPTPVSALIHAATMVTAGVYFITRNYVLFSCSQNILNTIAVIGLITVFFSSLFALIQNNIKKILAYSTISQMGYMFLSMGIKNWNAAILHLVTHSIFKTLLFLSAGAAIINSQHEQNIFKIQNLRDNLPFIYLCFIISSLSLASFPIITSGFFSKEKILISLFNYNIIFFTIAIISTFFTSLYIFRMITVIFFKKRKIQYFLLKINVRKKITFYFPLVILLMLSTYMGYINISFLQKMLIFNVFEKNYILKKEIIINIISGVFTILGMIFAVLIYRKEKQYNVNINILRFLCSMIDILYIKIFIKPYFFITKILHDDPIKKIMIYSTFFINYCNKFFSIFSNGYLNSYLISILIGSILLFIITIFY